MYTQVRLGIIYFKLNYIVTIMIINLLQLAQNYS